MLEAEFMVTLPPEPPKSKFVLHGIELNGSFTANYYGSKWHIDNLRFEETEIAEEDLKKLTEALKSQTEVPLEFGDGKGKAKIISIHYDSKKLMLTKISLVLINWGSNLSISS